MSRDIGPRPADCQRVSEPAPSGNLFVAAKRYQQALRKANKVIEQSCGAEWDRARKEFLAAGAGR